MQSTILTNPATNQPIVILSGSFDPYADFVEAADLLASATAQSPTCFGTEESMELYQNQHILGYITCNGNRYIQLAENLYAVYQTILWYNTGDDRDGAAEIQTIFTSIPPAEDDD